PGNFAFEPDARPELVGGLERDRVVLVDIAAAVDLEGAVHVLQPEGPRVVDIVAADRRDPGIRAERDRVVRAAAVEARALDIVHHVFAGGADGELAEGQLEAAIEEGGVLVAVLPRREPVFDAAAGEQAGDAEVALVVDAGGDDVHAVAGDVVRASGA